VAYGKKTWKEGHLLFTENTVLGEEGYVSREGTESGKGQIIIHYKERN